MKEAKNEFRIVGKLKSMKLEERKTQSGKDAIMGNITVEVTSGEKVHNHRINFFTFKNRLDGKENGMYKSYKTMMDTYKDADRFGNEADYVSVTGSVDYDVYNGANGVRENTRLRGMFANRITNTDTMVQEAIANIEAVVDKFTPEMKGTEMTGMINVSAYTVGYNDRGIKLINLKVPAELNMQDAIDAGTTLELTIQLNNYTVVKEVEKEDNGLLFGQVKKVAQDTSFVNNMEITGGAYAKNNYTDDDLQKMKKSVKEQISEAQAAKPSEASSQPATDITNKLPF